MKIFCIKLLETYTYIQAKLQKEHYDMGEVDRANEKVSHRSKIKQDRVSDDESISYEEFFEEELKLEKQKTESPKGRKQKIGDFHNYLILYTGLKFISAICTVLAVVLEGIFVFYGMRSGFTRRLFQYSVGGMLLIIAFVCGFIWSTQAVRKIKQDGKRGRTNSIKDNIKKQNKVSH